MSAISFDPAIEPRVRLLEETPPRRLVEELVDQLVAFPDGAAWFRALAFASLRSTKNEGLANGFLPHALIALHGARLLSGRLGGLRRLLPFLQTAAYANGAYRGGMRDPLYGPFRLAEADPLAAGSAEATERALWEAVAAGEVERADRHFQWLAERLPGEDLARLALALGLPGVAANAHKAIFPAQVLRLAADLEPALAGPLLRASIRYQASPLPDRGEYQRALAAVAAVDLRWQADDPPAAVDALRHALFAGPYDATPALVARALAGGLSIAGAMEAASLAAADLFLAATIAPGLDLIGPVHLMTGADALRQAAAVLPPRPAAAATILAAMNTDVAYTKRGISLKGDWRECLPPVDAGRGVEELYTAIEAAIAANDPAGAVAFARRYLALGGDPLALFDRIADVAATDNMTVMHAVKHAAACLELFVAARPESRHTYLLAAVKAAALYAGFGIKVYRRAAAALGL